MSFTCTATRLYNKSIHPFSLSFEKVHTWRYCSVFLKMAHTVLQFWYGFHFLYVIEWKIEKSGSGGNANVISQKLFNDLNCMFKMITA